MQGKQNGEGSFAGLMVTFVSSVRVGREFFAMTLELEDLLGRRVDLVERGAIERMENLFKRRSIPSCTQLVYAKQVA